MTPFQRTEIFLSICKLTDSVFDNDNDNDNEN